jgi:hypothetical protein
VSHVNHRNVLDTYMPHRRLVAAIQDAQPFAGSRARRQQPGWDQGRLMAGGPSWRRASALIQIGAICTTMPRTSSGADGVSGWGPRRVFAAGWLSAARSAPQRMVPSCWHFFGIYLV